MVKLQIFVSHSSSDKAVCDLYVSALRRAGADVWYDEHNLGAGQLMDEIQRQLRVRPVFIVLLSPPALDSKWVQRECKWAYTLADENPTRIILPVVISAITPRALNASMLFLSDFKRIEGPHNTPYPQQESIERTLRLLRLPHADTGTVILDAREQTAADLVTEGKALMARRQYSEAVAVYERATHLFPDTFGAWAYLGYAYGELERWQDELTACDRALSLEGSQAFVWSNKGLALKRLNRYDEALAAYDQALSLDPRSATFWNNKGVLLLAMKRYEEALTALDQSLALGPTNSALLNKSKALSALGRGVEAEAAMREAYGW